MDKKVKKLIDKQCYFCGENDYALLDLHRILEGSKGGKYNSFNTLTTCSNCHRKVHAGRIKILGKHYCTNGRYVLNFIDENGEEKWV